VASLKPIVLDYTRPPRSPNQRLAGLIIQMMRGIRSFLLERDLSVAETSVICWLTLTSSWALAAILGSYRAPEVIAQLGIGLFLAVVICLAILAWDGRWKAFLLCLSFIMTTGIASGVLQVHRCPHATYLQIMGRSIPIAGKACNNEQPSQPWWLQQ
jgi:hypothetical protein